MSARTGRDTIATAAARLAAGATTSADLVEASLAAIAGDGRRTNAFITIDAEGARAKARAADEERAAGIVRGPLHGMPISLKDLIDVRGVVTTAASRVLHDRVATSTAPAVSRLEAAGAIVIGRTNLHEFAFGTTSDASAFGAVHHPADPARSPGGSSGGSAAAVAAGMGLASIGTDTGGSVRVPAGVCAIVGLKPTFGEVPTDGVWPLSPSLDHVGPLAVSVQDAAWLYAVLAHRPIFTVRDLAPDTIRLARLVGYFDVLEAGVRAVFEQALARLTAAGTTITAAELAGAERIGGHYVNVVLPEAADVHAAFLDTRPADYTPSVYERIRQGRTTLAADYLAAQAFRRQLSDAVDTTLEPVDALVLPTLPIEAPLIGAETTPLGSNGSTMTVRAAMLRHTQPFNMSGHPAITIPIPAPGLPVGLQLVGRKGDTPRLLDVAAACERVLAQ